MPKGMFDAFSCNNGVIWVCFFKLVISEGHAKIFMDE